MNWLSSLSENPFYEFAIILTLAAVLGAIGQLLRQPLIVMFIALGILVGPSLLDVVNSEENIHLLAEIGIAVLLFIVGLKLDLRIIKSVGKIALLTGLGRFGTRLSHMLDEHPEINYLGIDFDPQVVRSWQKKGKNIIYGDMKDPELLEHVNFHTSKFVINTVPDFLHSRQLVKALKKENYKGKIYLTAITYSDFELLNKCGAEEVLMPQQMAAINFYNDYLRPAFQRLK